MVRKSSFIIGLALGLLWWIGVSQHPGARILWFDAVAAVLSFGLGGLVDAEAEENGAIGPAIACSAMGLGLAALWIVGMAAGQPIWANWLNFVFAVASVGTAVAVVAHGRHLTPAHDRI